MRFVSKSEVRSRLEGKRVAVVGSGPGCADNPPGLVDGHDVVIRVNNYRLVPPATGMRTDCHYSFYGTSVRKTAQALKNDGVTLCWCKCPDAHAIDSQWHRDNDKMVGVDFRWIYQRRKDFWFCDTYVPDVEEFRAKFALLGGHIPTTGFSAVLDVLGCKPKEVYLTGFDFFASGLHNVTDPWNEGRTDDPIRHVPELEAKWLKENMGHYPITTDSALRERLAHA